LQEKMFKINSKCHFGRGNKGTEGQMNENAILEEKIRINE